MAINRTDLDRPASTTIYILLTVILVILSFAGVYLLLQLKNPSPPPITQDLIPTITPEPTISSELVESTPTSTATKSAKPTSSPKPTVAPKLSATPTPTFLNYQSSIDGFQVTYSSTRKLYQDAEFSGNRYTFYLSSGNIAIHVGTQWSWTYPDRQFSSNLLVASQPTFVYGISTQRIVDLQFGNTKYSIQCIHNGKQTLIEECDQFIKDFKLL